MVLIETEIEIASPPEHVKEVFFDFAKLPEWAHGHITSIKPAAQNKSTIEKGDKLTVKLGGTTFNPVVLENSDREFKWRGSLWPIFTGDHTFRFEPSKMAPGSTRFVDNEEFSGLLSFLMGWPFGFGQQTKTNFEKFNQELKSRVESRLS